ncbi:hypothetical protein ACFU53_25495 [Streptomyces sp. NPDC057474]|uniref:GntT/GntP/DsdX family permease n=1 Tax=Streptomyces sp. NPDC057474 TaxID=3346144 RepID=UPI0036CA7BE4
MLRHGVADVLVEGAVTGRLSLVTLAMGAGGLAVRHINDAGHWVFTRLAGLDMASGLRTWSAFTTVMGCVGCALTAVIRTLVQRSPPLKGQLSER